jgi:uncharacterized coiled-coil protein SlyX
VSTSTSVTMFLNNNGGVFVAPVGADPVAALADTIGKEARSVRDAVKALQAKSRVWVRPVAKGDLPPAVGLHSKSHSTAEEEVSGPMPVQQLSLRGRMPEFLTLALLVLRRNSIECTDCSDHQGFGGEHRLVEANSCVDLLLGLLTGVSKDQAANLNSMLGRIGLRHSIAMGAGLFRHYVRVDVEEVTPEMLKPQVPEAPESDDLEQFLRYVEGLEKRVAELEPLEGQIARQLAQITELNELLRQRDEEIETLNAQIQKLQSDTDLAARMRGILDRSQSRK